MQSIDNTRILIVLGMIMSGTAWQPLSAQQTQSRDAILDALTFHAPFDGTVEARVARGDRQLYTVVQARPEEEVKAGLHAYELTRIAPGAGLHGDALRFTAKQANRLFYLADKNLAYRAKDWQGTVSLWLRLDPEDDLEPGFCDPIQITPRKWNDAAFFVDFDKEGDPRDFRLGAFADYSVWNPENRSIGDIPESERPLLPVKSPPFSGDKWTHVVFTWQDFNSGDKSGQASFYLDGELQGRLTGWNQQFTWQPDETCRIQIGLNYIGLMDDLAIFNRALSDGEVGQLYRLRGGLQTRSP